MLDDLFTYRLAPDRFLTVTNAANHARDLAWFRGHAEGRDAAVADRIADFAMLAVQGPEAGARGARAARGRRAAGPLRHRGAHGGRRPACSSAARATRARTARSCSSRPTGPSRCGTRCAPPGWSPPGSARATRCASRPVTTSTATTCPRTAARSRPAWGGAARRPRASSAPRPSRACAPRARPRSSSPSRSPAPASPARATPSRAAASSPRARSRPASGTGSGMAYLPGRARRPRHAVRDRRAREAARAEVRSRPLYSKER